MNPIKLIFVTLDEKSYHVFLSFYVEGVKCRFLLDTGASKTVIDKAFAEKLIGNKKIKTVNKETRGLHSVTNETSIVKVKSFVMGNVEIKNHLFAAIDLTHVNETYKSLRKPRIQGILGSDILLETKAIIDYGKRQLHFG